MPRQVFIDSMIVAPIVTRYDVTLECRRTGVIGTRDKGERDTRVVPALSLTASTSERKYQSDIYCRLRVCIFLLR